MQKGGFYSTYKYVTKTGSGTLTSRNKTDRGENSK
jgi:hypothetical protein